MTAIRFPCKTCPWRVDQHAQDIPDFRLDLAEGLVSTTPDMSPIQFACHQSKDGDEIVCAGWLARYGWDNLGARMSALTGRTNPAQLEAAEREDWPETHETFEEVITKLRADCAREEEQ